MKSRNGFALRALAVLGLSLAIVGIIQMHSAPAADTEFKALSAGSAGCAANSRSPEVYTFYGDSDTIVSKLANFDMDLPNRRTYALVVESTNGTDVALFENAQEKVNVHRWTNKDGVDVRTSLDKVILDNKGVHCVGEQVKDALTSSLKDAKVDRDAPLPANAKSAFGHSIQKHKDAFIRATVYLLC